MKIPHKSKWTDERTGKSYTVLKSGKKVIEYKDERGRTGWCNRDLFEKNYKHVPSKKVVKKSPSGCTGPR